MTLRSELLSIELPDASGKTVPYFTYDGYLEETDRHKIRTQVRSSEQLKYTGGALLGFLSFVVRTLRRREQGDCPCLYWHSRDCTCQLLDFSQESSEEWLVTKSSEFTATVESTLSRERSCLQLNTFRFGLTSEMQSILTEHILS